MSIQAQNPHIPKVRPGICDCPELEFLLQLLEVFSHFSLDLLNIGRWNYHVNYIKYGGIANIMDALLKYFLLHELIRLLSYISQILYGFISFVDEGYLPP